MKLNYHFTLYLTIFLLLWLFPARSNIAKADNAESKSQHSEQKFLQAGMINFEPPPDNKAPKVTSAGGSRNGCSSTELANQDQSQTLTALLPTSTSQWLTVKDHPGFLLYLPPTAASALFFQIKDNQENLKYQDILPIQANQAQVIEIGLPQNQQGLELNQNYQWSVFLLCNYNPKLHAQDVESFEQSYDLMNEPWLMGSVKRVEATSTLSNQPDDAISLELAKQYAQNGLWFDTLAILAQLRRSQPDNQTFIQAWEELLQAEGFDANIVKAKLEQLDF